MATYNGQDESSNDGDVFQDLRAWEIERYFKHKLKSFLTSDQTQTQKTKAPQTENKFDIETELLDFINDFQNFKRAQDDKSVTSEDVDEDEDDESDSDSEEDDESGEEAAEDDASVVVEGSISGLSSKDFDLIEALTDSRQRGERRNVEKQLSLLDLDENDLNRKLKGSRSKESSNLQVKPSPPNDFLSSFQDEMNKLEESKSEKGSKVKTCYVCGGEIKNIGDYKTSLDAHKKELFHILKWKEKQSSAKSECSSVIGEAALPEFIFVNGNNHFCCKICKGRPIGLYRDKLLTHLQSEEHRMNLQTRFDDSKPQKDDRRRNKDREETKQTRFDDPKTQKDDRRRNKNREEVKKDETEPKKDKLAYAIGFACIKPVNENQLLCTMCDKYIPVAKEMSTLMKNLSHHIESKSHINRMEGLQESLKTIKENPSVQEAKKKLHDNVYKFICLPCNFDGYGYEFCKSHLKNTEHNSRIKILLDAKVHVNFNHGVKCVGCNKYIYGAKINIDEHCVKCIKENGNNAVRGRPRRNRSRPRRQNNRNDRDNTQKRNPRQNQGNRGRRPHNNQDRRQNNDPNNQHQPSQSNRRQNNDPNNQHRSNQNNVAKADRNPPRNNRPAPTGNSIVDGFVMLDKPRRVKKQKDVCVIS